MFQVLHWGRTERHCYVSAGRRCFGRRMLCDLILFSSEVQESGTSTGRWPSFLQFLLESVSQLLAALEKGHSICGGWSAPPGKTAIFLPKGCSCLNMRSNFLSVIDKMSMMWPLHQTRETVQMQISHIWRFETIFAVERKKSHIWGMKHCFSETWDVSHSWRVVKNGGIKCWIQQPRWGPARSSLSMSSKHTCLFIYVRTASHTEINTDSQSTHMNTENTRSSLAE